MSSRERSHGRVVATSVLVVAGALVAAACAPRTFEGFPPQAYYRTGFPLTDVSGELERVFRAVLRIQMDASYDVHVFREQDAPTDDELDSDGDALARAARMETSSVSRAATAILLATNGRRGTLLATDHAITFPDSILAYFPGRPGGGPRTLERVAIKRRQANTVVGAAFVQPFQILARDPRGDLALLGVDVPEGAGAEALASFRVPMGAPARLSWGSLVYVLGYPTGRRMVTHAIVSRSERGTGESFLTDALLNEGTSGAAILAVRGATEELEWVGIARAAATRAEQRLVPEPGVDRSGRPDQPYDGPIYIREVDEIRYGITFSIPVGDVRAFLRDHRVRLAAAGYATPDV